MRSRHLLHRSKLEEFKQYLIDQGIEVLPNKGDYEVLRWKGLAGTPMPIVFDRHGGDHFTTNGEASKYVFRWIKSKRDNSMAQQQYDNNMSGVLFKNENRTNDKQPNARGSCEIDGKEYWISAWTRKSRNGQLYQSLAFQEKDASSKPAPSTPDYDDDIPF